LKLLVVNVIVTLQTIQMLQTLDKKWLFNSNLFYTGFAYFMSNFRCQATPRYIDP